MGPTSEMLLAASPVMARKLSSVIGVRAKPAMAYRGPSELRIARSNIAGITLRFARSPDAPNRTTVQEGSTTPLYTEPERLVSAAIFSPSAKIARSCGSRTTKSFTDPKLVLGFTTAQWELHRRATYTSVARRCGSLPREFSEHDGQTCSEHLRRGTFAGACVLRTRGRARLGSRVRVCRRRHEDGS